MDKVSSLRVKRLVLDKQLVGYRVEVYTGTRDGNFYDVELDSIRTDYLAQLAVLSHENKFSDLRLKVVGDLLVSDDDSKSYKEIENISDNNEKLEEVFNLVDKHLFSQAACFKNRLFSSNEVYLVNGLALFNPRVDIVVDGKYHTSTDWTISVVVNSAEALTAFNFLAGEMSNFDKGDLKSFRKGDKSAVFHDVGVSEEGLLKVLERFKCPISIYGGYKLGIYGSDEEETSNDGIVPEPYGDSFKSATGVWALMQIIPDMSPDGLKTYESYVKHVIDLLDSWAHESCLLRYNPHREPDDMNSFVDYATLVNLK